MRTVYTHRNPVWVSPSGTVILDLSNIVAIVRRQIAGHLQGEIHLKTGSTATLDFQDALTYKHLCDAFEGYLMGMHT